MDFGFFFFCMHLLNCYMLDTNNSEGGEREIVLHLEKLFPSTIQIEKFV